VRQGPQSRAPRYIGCAGHGANHGGRGLCLSRYDRNRRSGVGWHRYSCRCRIHGVSRRSVAANLRIAEIEASVAAGAREIDIVISRRHVLSQNWQALYDEMRAFRDACGDAHVKAILATGELGSLRNVARASMICMMAGADFIKTSTGKESVNATLPVSLVMIRAIRDYYDRTGYMVGYKPAGGISKAKDALVYLSMMNEELGRRWLENDLFRFGASSLMGDIERQLDHHVTGAYSAANHHAMG
jgi:deoxyribose-phosphate aldolase